MLPGDVDLFPRETRSDVILREEDHRFRESLNRKGPRALQSGSDARQRRAVVSVRATGQVGLGHLHGTSLDCRPALIALQSITVRPTMSGPWSKRSRLIRW